MLRKTLIVFAFLIGVVHVMGAYLMPNMTYRPAAKNKICLTTKSHKHADTASENPFKLKFRKFFCPLGVKKVSVSIATFRNLIAGYLTFKLNEFLQDTVKNVFHFNLSYLRVPPSLILNKCCWLI